VKWDDTLIEIEEVDTKLKELTAKYGIE